MRTIHKYPFEIADSFSIEMPNKAQILTVQAQHGQPCIWAIVDTAEPMQKRRFQLRGTGHDCSSRAIHPMAYVDTFQLRGGDIVFHLFEDSSEN